jgi:hypothetical protein
MARVWDCGGAEEARTRSAKCRPFRAVLACPGIGDGLLRRRGDQFAESWVARAPLGRRRLSALFAAAFAVVAACAALVPASAQASAHRSAVAGVVRPEDGWGETDTSTPLFYQPTSADGYYSVLSSGNWIDLVCWIDGGSYDGSNRWFQADYYGSRYYVAANQIAQPQPSLPVCG